MLCITKIVEQRWFITYEALPAPWFITYKALPAPKVLLIHKLALWDPFLDVPHPIGYNQRSGT
jgi:hypothetical protein